jgi:hypothetical protein
VYVLSATTAAYRDGNFTLVLGYHEASEDGAVEATEVVERATYSRFHGVVDGGGGFRTEPPVANASATYAADGRIYRRRDEDGNYSSSRLTINDARPLERATGIIRSAVDGASTEIVGQVERNGTVLYRVAFSGNAADDVVDSNGELLITSGGHVRRMSWRYRNPDDGVRVTVRLTFSDVGDTNVSAPPWVAAARNASDDG